MTASTSPSRRSLALAFAAALCALAGMQPVQPAHAQTNWPTKPIRLIVAGPAGGTADVLARVLAEGLQQGLGQPVIVESKAGGSGAIAIQELKAKGKDGHTFLVIQDGAVSEAPLAYKLAFDPFNDLKPLAQISRTSLVLVAHNELPVANLAELVRYGKAQKDGLPFASYAAGFKGHTSGMLLGQLTKMDMRHVGYKGSPPALVDLMGGHVPLMFDGVTTSLPLLKSGKIKALAVTSPTRIADLPDVPTFAELGYPQLSMSGWFAVWSHPQAPVEIQKKLREATLAHLKKPQAIAQLRAIGMEAGQAITSEAMTAELKDATRKQAALLKSIGYQPE
jgi:tripartite-type tricarboxylate transporter receptor subunit TctC